MKDRFFQGCSKFKRQEILQTDLQNERKVSKVVNKKSLWGIFMELINQIFAKENVNSGRQMEIDLAKVVFVLMVAAVHITIDCVPEEALSTGLPYVFDSVIGGPMIAPGLMFAMGACLVYSRRQGWKDIFHRGIIIFILGFVLNLCRYTIPDLIGYAISGDTERYLDPILYQTFNNDIFQFAGLALMTIALFLKLKLKDGVMVGIALLCSIIGTLLNGVDVGSVPGNMILGYFVGVEDAAGEVLSYFVYLNWLIMPVSGYVFGKLLKRMKDKDLFYRMAVPVCLLVAVPYYVLRIRNRIGMFGLGESCYYHVTTPDVLICLVTAIGMYGIYYFIGKHLPQKAVAAAYRIGADMTAFYFIHWLFVAAVIYLGVYLIRGTQILPMPWILVLAVLVTVVSLVLADLWMHKWKNIVFRKVGKAK